jgi:uncharacterized membrane protein
VEKTIRGTSINDIVGFVYSLALVALALFGMAGVLYHAFAPKGSLGAWAGRLWTAHPIFASLVVVGLVAMALTARSQQVSYQRAAGRSDLPLYVFVALGTFFAARWVTSGAL